MASVDVWHAPSARCAELITSGARLMLDAPEIFDEVDQAVLAAAGASITSDPMLAASMRATDRANLVHWLTSNIRAPGERVAANVGPDTLGIARDLVRRGLDDRATEAYRAGQNVAWRRWMELAFALTSDPGELHELLDVTSRSIFAFIDDTLAGINEEIDRERETLTSGTEVARLEVVNLILAGAPIPADRASARLQYELRRRHVAAILWSAVPAPDQGAIGRAADAIARAAGAARAFTVAPAPASLWAWFASARTPDTEALAAVLEDAPAVRVAIGSAGFGVDGFRR
ncbi:MAG: PucR family transcriptional regulator, partial [Solirubrobacteraceae bacterium]